MQDIINKLKAEDNMRTLTNSEMLGCDIIIDGKNYLNLSTNDYLGISSGDLQQKFFNDILNEKSYLMSNPSSRLMTGNSYHYSQLENLIASLYNKESATIFSSGYLLNSGVIPAITTPSTHIIADKLVHASIIDGLRLSDGKFSRFKHNSISHLRDILERQTKDNNDILVILESIYSMDGDLTPLLDIIELKKEFSFKIYLDEAHAFGVRGEKGLGLAEELHVIDEIDYIVATLGKAASSCGAFIVCSNLAKDIIVNKCRSIIFSTALPPINLLWSKYIIEKIVDMKAEREHLLRLSKYLNKDAESHIIPIIAGDNSRVLKLVTSLKDAGLWATAIRYPTVSKGAARVRISLNAAMTYNDIDKILAAL